eukprot:208491-Chlamydomonas_euryale.AAC.2
MCTRACAYMCVSIRAGFAERYRGSTGFPVPPPNPHRTRCMNEKHTATNTKHIGRQTCLQEHAAVGAGALHVGSGGDELVLAQVGAHRILELLSPPRLGVCVKRRRRGRGLRDGRCMEADRGLKCDVEGGHEWLVGRGGGPLVEVSPWHRGSPTPRFVTL